MSDEMKKWAPFKSIVEQEVFLNKMRYEKNKIPKPQISSEEADDINYILTHYNNETLTISFYYDGYVRKINTKLKKIDPYTQRVYLSRYEYIPLNAIVGLTYFDN